MVTNSEMITRRSIKAARARARANVEANMVSEITITRADVAVLDPDGLLTADTTPFLVYAGKARLTSAQGPVTYTIGEEVQFFSSGNATIPIVWSFPAPGTPPQPIITVPTYVQVNDLLTVTGHDDPVYVGRHFRVVDVEVNGLLSGGRRLQIVGVQRYPGWIDSAVRHPSVGRIPDEVPPEWRI
jgi:hypothetical protein